MKDWEKKYDFKLETSQIKQKKEDKQLNSIIIEENSKLTNQTIQCENSKINHSMSRFNENDNSMIESTSYENLKEEELEPKEKYKIKVDNMNKTQHLIKRLQINRKICELFLENFYLDDYNNTRRGFYLLFSAPFLTFFGFFTLNPYHPLRRICTAISLFGSIFFTGISYHKDMENISSSNSNLGRKIRNLRNELVLYNQNTKIFFEENNKKL